MDSGRGRASGDAVVDVDHLVQGLDGVVQRGDGQLSLGGLVRGLGDHGGVLVVVSLEVGGGRGLGVDVVQDLLGSSGNQVGQGGASAEHGAGSVGDDDLGLLPQQLGHVLVLGVPDGSVDEGDGDLSVLHGGDVLLLSIGGDGPHDDLGHVADGQQPLVGVQQGHVASTAGSGPVDGQLDLSSGGCSGEEGSEVGCGQDGVLGDVGVSGGLHGRDDEGVGVGVSALGLRGLGLGCLGGLRGCGLGLEGSGGRGGLGLRLRCGSLFLLLFLLLEQLVKESHQFASF